MMNRITGKITLTFADTATGEQLLEAEQYLNNVVDKMCYANKAFSIRVHLGPTPEDIADSYIERDQEIRDEFESIEPSESDKQFIETRNRLRKYGLLN